MRKKEKQEMKTKIFIHFLQNKYSHLMSSLLRAGTIKISKKDKNTYFDCETILIL